MSTQQGLSCTTRSQKPMISIAVTRESVVGDLNNSGDTNKNRKPMQGERSLIDHERSKPNILSSKPNTDNNISATNDKSDGFPVGCASAPSTKISAGHSSVFSQKLGQSSLPAQTNGEKPNDCSVALPDPLPTRIVHIAPPIGQQIMQTTSQTKTTAGKSQNISVPLFQTFANQTFANQTIYSVINRPVPALPGNYLTNNKPVRLLVPVQGPVCINQSRQNQLRNGNDIIRFAPPQTDRIQSMKYLPVKPSSNASPQIVYLPSHIVPISQASSGGQFAAPFSPELKPQKGVPASTPEVRSYPGSACISECQSSPLPLYQEPHRKEDYNQTRPQVTTPPKFTLAGNQASTVSSASCNRFNNLTGCPEQQVRPGCHFRPSYAARGQSGTVSQESVFDRKPTQMCDVDDAMKDVISEYILRCRLAESNNYNTGDVRIQTSPLDLSQGGELMFKAAGKDNEVANLRKTNSNIPNFSSIQPVMTTTSLLDSNYKSQSTAVTVDNTNAYIAKQNIGPNQVKPTDLNQHISPPAGVTALRDCSGESGRAKSEENSSVQGDHPEVNTPCARLVNGEKIKYESPETILERLSRTNALPKQESSINKTEKEIKSECMDDITAMSCGTQVSQQEANTTSTKTNTFRENRIKSEKFQQEEVESVHADQVKDKDEHCVTEEQESSITTNTVFSDAYEQLCEKSSYIGSLDHVARLMNSPPLPGYMSVVFNNNEQFVGAEEEAGRKTPMPDSAPEIKSNANYIQCVSGYEMPPGQASENIFDNHIYHRSNPVLDLSSDSPLSVNCLDPDAGLHSVRFQDSSLNSDNGELMGIDPEKFTKDAMFLTQPAKDLRWGVIDLMWDIDGIFNDPNGYGFDSFKVARRYHIFIAKALASITTLINSIVKLAEFQNKNNSDLNFWSYDGKCFSEFSQDLKKLMMNNVQGFNKISNHLQRLAQEGLVLTRNIYPNSKFVPEELSSLTTQSWHHDPDEFACLTALFPEVSFPNTEEKLAKASPLKTGQNKPKQQESVKNGDDSNKQERIINEPNKSDKSSSVDSDENCVDNTTQGKPKVTCSEAHDRPRESSSRHTSRSSSKGIREDSMCSLDRLHHSPSRSRSSLQKSRSRNQNSRIESTKSSENNHDSPKHVRRGPGRPRKTESHTDNQMNISRERKTRTSVRKGPSDQGRASRDRRTRSRSRDQNRFSGQKWTNGQRTRTRYVEEQRGYGDVPAGKKKARRRRQNRVRPRKRKTSQDQSQNHRSSNNEIRNVAVCMQPLDAIKLKSVTGKSESSKDKTFSQNAINETVTPPNNPENNNLNGKYSSTSEQRTVQTTCSEDECSDIVSKGEWIVVDELNTSNSPNPDNSSDEMSSCIENTEQGRSEGNLAMLTNQSQADSLTAGIDRDISQPGHTTKTDKAKAAGRKLESDTGKATTAPCDRMPATESTQDCAKKTEKREKPRVRHRRKRKSSWDTEASTKNKQKKLENISTEQQTSISQTYSESVEHTPPKDKYALSILEKLSSLMMTLREGSESTGSRPSHQNIEQRSNDVCSDNDNTTREQQDRDLSHDSNRLFSKSRQTTFINEPSTSGGNNETDSRQNIIPHQIKNMESKKNGDSSEMSIGPLLAISERSAKSYKRKGMNKSKKAKKQIEKDDRNEGFVDNALKPLGRPVSPQEVIGPLKKRGFQNKQECFEILDVVYNTDIHDYFTHEIKSRDVPDYYKIVKYPMCLDVVAHRIRQGLYADLGSFVHDMRRIFWNCRLYYKDNNHILADCKRVESFFENKLRTTFPNMDFSDIHGSPKYQKTQESPKEKDNQKSRSCKTKKFNIPRELRELFG